MPQFFIEAPAGIKPDAKQRMMREITAAVDEAYHIPDVRIWLREYTSDNVAQDGQIGAEPIRPLCFLEAPELNVLEIKRTMSAKICAAVTEAYDGLANTDGILILMNHYPLVNAAAGTAGRLHSDNLEMVQALKELNA